MKRIGRVGFAVTAACALAAWAFAGCSESSPEVKKYSPTPTEDASVTVDGGGNDANTGLVPRCSEIGGTASTRGLVTNILSALSNDCRIGPYFSNLTPQRAQHHEDCMANFLLSAMECTDGAGAKILYSGSKDRNGQACRANMAQAHQNIAPLLTKDDYNAFIEAVGKGLDASGVNSKPVRTSVLAAFTGQSTGVYNANKLGNYNCAPGCATCVDGGPLIEDAGDAGDASDTGAAGDTGAPEAGDDAAPASDGGQDAAAD